jgi:hypothetical protein
LRALLHELGLKENVPKFIEPAQHGIIVGVAFDFVVDVASVTAERRAKFRARVSEVVRVDKVSGRDLFALASTLNFVGAVIPLSRAFTHPLYRAAVQRGVNSPRLQRLAAVVRRCLVWWMAALDTYNGRACFSRALVKVIDDVATDAAKPGFGAVWVSRLWYIMGLWPASVVDGWSSNAKELATIVVACAVWGHEFSGCVVRLKSDNMVSVYAIQKSSAVNPLLHYLLSVAVLLQLKFCFLLDPDHIPGLRNVDPDNLSRGVLSLPHPDYLLWPTLDLVSLLGDVVLVRSSVQANRGASSRELPELPTGSSLGSSGTAQSTVPFPLTTWLTVSFSSSTGTW